MDNFVIYLKTRGWMFDYSMIVYYKFFQDHKTNCQLKKVTLLTFSYLSNFALKTAYLNLTSFSTRKKVIALLTTIYKKQNSR